MNRAPFYQRVFSLARLEKWERAGPRHGILIGGGFIQGVQRRRPGFEPRGGQFGLGHPIGFVAALPRG